MSRLLRPNPPLAVRLTVALRQLGKMEVFAIPVYVEHVRHTRRLGVRLSQTLDSLAHKIGCPRDQLRLDHDPALENRLKLFVRDFHVDYNPLANDPEYLFYRPHGPEFIGSHLIKTNVHGDHGQHSDRAMAAKNKNIARNRDPKRKKTKICSANRWPPKGSQKIQNRRRRCF